MRIANLKAVIFDMDGVLVDNTSYHLKSWQIFLRQHGLDFSEREFKEKILGRINPEIIKTVFQGRFTKKEIKKYANEKERIYRKIYSPHIKPVKGLESFLKELRKNKIRIALATAAPSENVDFVLRATRTKKYFEKTADMSDIKKGKPNPEIFLKVAKKLKIKPASCIVIEDSLGGIRAAKRAKMKVVAVLTTHSRKELGKADLFVKDFSTEYRNKILKFIENKKRPTKSGHEAA